jgi:hypothetical protein
VIHDELVPGESQIFGWIEEVVSHGIRRPGYPADRWAEGWLQERFREIGLEQVRAEPVELASWEPRDARLTVSAGSESFELPCFPLPHSSPITGLEAEIVAFDADAPSLAKDSLALCDVTLNRIRHSVLRGLATWSYDPDGTYEHGSQILPFGRQVMHVMEPAINAGAAAFIGVLAGYPGDSYEYYVPYDAVAREIPGVWVSGSSGVRLRELIATGPLRARLEVDSTREPIVSYNIIGELPGADEEVVIIGSHHDGPWTSAVEDGSGIALVLAQAEYWSRVPQHERPHRLVFLLNAGHMAGGAGQRTFVESHEPELERVVLELHLEHAANELTDEGSELRATGQPESRWWFTSRIPRLENAVQSAIEAEDLRRSLIMPPTVFGPQPTTDAAAFYTAGVPIVNFLAAPFYLFDSMDTIDKIHRPSLVPVTRAAIRIVASTSGVSAAAMRDPQEDVSAR